jgi:hypothetical protein
VRHLDRGVVLSCAAPMWAGCLCGWHFGGLVRFNFDFIGVVEWEVPRSTGVIASVRVREEIWVDPSAGM